MSEYSELVKRLRDKRRGDWSSNGNQAAGVIERLAPYEDGTIFRQMDQLMKQLADARAREGRLASHLCQALGQWQMYAEMQEDCDLSRDDTPEADLYRLAHNVLVGREALAAPAPGKDSEGKE